MSAALLLVVLRENENKTMSGFKSRMAVCVLVHYHILMENSIMLSGETKKPQIHSECTDENTQYHIVIHAIISFLPINKWKLIMCKSVVVNI